MRVMALHVATTGLPRRENGRAVSHTRPSFFPRIVAMEWTISVDDDTAVTTESWVVHPDGEYTIPEYTTCFHGLTDHTAQLVGATWSQVAGALDGAIASCDLIVAHNADFHINVLKSELHRRGEASILTNLNSKHVQCTVLTGFEILGLTKWPRLEELRGILQLDDVDDTTESQAPSHVEMVKCLKSGMCMECYKSLQKIAAAERCAAR